MSVHPVVRAGMDAGMVGVAFGWIVGALPHLAWVIPTIYYAVLLSKEWPPACSLCAAIRDRVKGLLKR